MMHNKILLSMQVNSLLFKSLLGYLFLTQVIGCGFQLRGAYRLPDAMKVTFVSSSQPGSGLTRALKRGLSASNITLSAVEIKNSATLSLSNMSKTKRVVSVDDIGRAREYTLTYAVRFNVVKLAADFKVESQNISIQRDFVFDSKDVLGNSREESQLYGDMEQDLVRLILLRLQSYVKK